MVKIHKGYFRFHRAHKPFWPGQTSPGGGKVGPPSKHWRIMESKKFECTIYTIIKSNEINIQNSKILKRHREPTMGVRAVVNCRLRDHPIFFPVDVDPSSSAFSNPKGLDQMCLSYQQVNILFGLKTLCLSLIFVLHICFGCEAAFMHGLNPPTVLWFSSSRIFDHIFPPRFLSPPIT